MMMFFKFPHATWLPLFLFLLTTMIMVGCGGNDNGETQFDCSDHSQCLDDEACLGDVCVDAPDEGDDCPDYEGEQYEELLCEDGVWIIADEDAQISGLGIVTAPPVEVTAGEVFDVAIELLDDSDDRAEIENIDVVLSINQNEFASGDTEITQSTDPSGVAEFEIAIDEVDTDYILSATAEGAEGDEFDVDTDSFDVTAPTANDLSFVTPPPEESTAGEPFDVGVALVDAQDEALAMEDVEITLSINRNEFANGDTEVTASTDSTGVADFELTIEIADTGLVLTATAEDEDLEDLSANSDIFAVVATDADADASWIEGEDGAEADGSDEAEITIILIDEFGNPVSGQTPEFSASGDGNEYGECSETNSDGLATCYMTSTEQGEKLLEITSPVEKTGDTIEFLYPCDESGSPFGGGNGSSDDPFSLCTPDHLSFVGDSTSFLDDHFILAQNIDMDGVDDFQLIGDEDDPFVGHFDGNGLAIENLTIDEDKDHVGVFGETGGDAYVENLTITNIDVTGKNRVGGLVGLNRGDIHNCRVSGDVEGASTLGGLIGRHISGTVSSSSAAVDISSTGNIAGGFVGFVGSNTEITDSRATGDISNNGGEQNGGFAGRMMGGKISGSYATGDVTNLDGDGTIRGDGGFVGWITNSGVITDSYAMGDVQVSESSNVAGFVGLMHPYHEGYFENCYATGQTDTGRGFGGSSNRDISSSYWDIDTSGTDDAGSGGDVDGVTGLSTDEFDDEANFEGWDFSDIWVIDVAPDGEERPILQWQLD